MRFIKTLFIAVLFSLGIHSVSAQSYYDSGKYDFLSHIHYDENKEQYHLYFNKSNTRIFSYDTALVISNLILDKSFHVVSEVALQSQDFNTNMINRGLRLMNDDFDVVLMYEDNAPINKSCKICKVNDSSIYDCITVTPNGAHSISMSAKSSSIYAPNTLFFYALWFKNDMDTVGDYYGIKYNYQNHTISRENYTPIIGVNIDEKEYLKASGNFVRLPNNDIIALGQYVKEINGGVNFGYRYIHLNSSLDSMINTYTSSRSTLPNMNGNTYVKTWSSGNKIYSFFTGMQFNNATNMMFEDYLLEVLDLTKDTIPERYFFDLVDSTNTKFIENSAKAAYFNGKHFVFAGTADINPSFTNKNMAIQLFTVDTNFNIINSMSIENKNSPSFYGEIKNIIPHPDSVGKIIYAGDISYKDLSSGTRDMFWGSYDIEAHTSSLPQIKLRKAETYIYPNPSNGQINILYRGDDFEPYNLSVFNTQGKEMAQFEINKAQEKLDLSLASGVYTVVANVKGYSEVQRIVIQ